MIELKDITELLQFATVRIVCGNSCGTGFFFEFDIDGMKIPCLITNKHVVKRNSNAGFSTVFHVRTEEGEIGIPNARYSVDTANWLFHPDHDLCALDMRPVIEDVRKAIGRELYFESIPESLLITGEMENDLTALERVVMYGYPTGLYDTLNNLPLIRNGYTASHPALDFQEQGIGVVDMSSVPGSSGSPVFIFNEGGYRNKKSGGLVMNSRLLLLGIMKAMQTLRVEGDILEVEVSDQEKAISNVPVHLGFYVKATELLKFKPMLKRSLDASTK